MKKIFDVVVLGAGASGLAFSSFIGKCSCAIVDHNDKIGAKVLVSGGGKCNVTNRKVTAHNYLGDNDFISQVFKKYDNNKFLKWLKGNGLELVERERGQLFCKNSAKELLEIFRKQTKEKVFMLDSKIVDVKKEKEYFKVVTSKESIFAKNIVVATGGVSFGTLGATDIGYTIASKFGHKIAKTAPALVGLTLQKEQFFFKELSGVALENVAIRVANKQCSGSLLFAHRGISGPVILDTSLYWDEGAIEINFLPEFAWGDLQGSKKLLSTLLPLPKKFIKLFLEHIKMADLSFVDYTKEQKVSLQKALCNYTFAPSGTFGYNKAEVTKGGIATDMINPRTMESLIVSGLYFIGEVVDVTGELGGYNFQWCFSSAYVCAKDIKEKVC